MIISKLAVCQDRRMPRSRAIGLACALLLLAGCAPAPPRPEESPASTADPATADAVMAIVRDTMAEAHLKAVIVRVTVDGKEVVTQCSRRVDDRTCPQSTEHALPQRRGRDLLCLDTVADLVDENKVRLDDKLSKWLPDMPHAEKVTLGQLAQMTSGYVDYVIGNTEFEKALYADPFRQWEPDELLGFATNKPLLYEPGTNWNYAHTNYVLLGMALEKATGKDMPTLLEDKVLRPLGLNNTANSDTPQIPAPVAARVHLVSAATRCRSPAAHRSTRSRPIWNPSWTITHGAIQTTNIYDLEATRGRASAPASCCPRLLRGISRRRICAAKPGPQPGCATCIEQNDGYTYGLGIVISGDWLLQNPLFAGDGRRRGLPAREEDRHGGRRNISARGVRRSGQLPQRSRHAVPQDRRGNGPRRRAASAARNSSDVHGTASLCSSTTNTSRPRRLLGDAFTECGYDVATFGVVPWSGSTSPQ